MHPPAYSLSSFVARVGLPLHDRATIGNRETPVEPTINPRKQVLMIKSSMRPRKHIEKKLSVMGLSLIHSDAADDLLCVDLCGPLTLKNKKQ